MISVVLLGTGNVASHIFRAFSVSENVKIIQVYGRTKESLSRFGEFSKITTTMEDLMDADIYLLALKDDVISQFSQQLKGKIGMVVHTSGGISIDALKDCPRRGVFYPLQTFLKDRPMEYRGIPLCLEPGSANDMGLLKILGREFSGMFYEISSHQRKNLHLAAVFVCNFVNHLYVIGEDICERNNMPFEILQPLIRETALRAGQDSPVNLQTGPAKRGDQKTIEAHLDLIPSEEQKNIYQLLTNAIKNLHGKKL